MIVNLIPRWQNDYLPLQRDGSCPGWDGAGWCEFHDLTHNGTQFKTYELFIPRSSHLIFLDRG